MIFGLIAVGCFVAILFINAHAKDRRNAARAPGSLSSGTVEIDLTYLFDPQLGSQHFADKPDYMYHALPCPNFGDKR